MKNFRLSERSLLWMIGAAFALWAAHFIFRNSTIAIDGRRYFSLFDDAMISMRYAWNFAHGRGLVWNAGEYVEGYTNLLMTLIMALATRVLDKVGAVLAIQVFGIGTMLAIGVLAVMVTSEVIEDAWPPAHKSLARIIVFACALGYFPLAYWTLMGMETGLMTALILAGMWCAFRWGREPRPTLLAGMAVCFGLAFLTRSDSAIYAALVFAFVAYDGLRTRQGPLAMRDWLWPLAGAAALYAAFIGGHTLFRWMYYGELLPNTYVLKVTGIPLSVRIDNGRGFVMPFLKESFLPLGLAAIGLVLRPHRRKLLLASFIVAAVSYQVYVGGDPWNYWRQMAPAMPVVFILATLAAVELVSALAKTQVFQSVVSRAALLQQYSVAALIIAIVLMSLVSVDFRFKSEISPRGTAYTVLKNWRNINTAVALNEVTREDASLGVFFAGTIPYYVDRQAIDFLGKSDKHVANLPPDLSGLSGGYGMYTLPGHNKYDLNYSIKTLRPTYVQDLVWAQQDITEWATGMYVRAYYEDVELILLKDSPVVRWELLTVTN
jgi:arabinofuranosyltransferase